MFFSKIYKNFLKNKKEDIMLAFFTKNKRSPAPKDECKASELNSV